jgi:NAD(P)-dependent dehydrogenase (short-subunit alcohol dehydrogenase family)
MAHGRRASHRVSPAQLLLGRVALVTGAASGIGRVVAMAFADHGAAAVVVADLRPDPREGGTPTHELLSAHGARSAFLKVNVAEPE